MTRIITAGPHCSGSTWLYNTVRLLADSIGNVHAAFVDQYNPDSPEPVHVVKCHGWRPGLTPATVITVYRDPRSMLASALARRLVPGDPIRWLEGELLEHRWTEKAVLRCRYEYMVDQPKVWTGRVAMAAGLDCSPAVIERVASEVAGLTEPATGSDPVTLLHAGHRTGVDWREVLTEEQVRGVEGRFGSWLARHGYGVGVTA